MRKLTTFFVCCAICVLAPSRITGASPLIWIPINPSFGGSPYNASWLMASAQAQNKLVEKTTPYRFRDTLEDFQNNLNRQILSRLSRRIVDAAFGEEGLDSGFYDLGDFTIDVTTDVDGIHVVITETQTGSETRVEVPYY